MPAGVHDDGELHRFVRFQTTRTASSQIFVHVLQIFVFERLSPDVLRYEIYVHCKFFLLPSVTCRLSFRLPTENGKRRMATEILSLRIANFEVELYYNLAEDALARFIASPL